MKGTPKRIQTEDSFGGSSAESQQVFGVRLGYGNAWGLRKNGSFVSSI